MITIDRTSPWVTVQGERIRLTRAEHELITVLGMMNEQLVPADLLMDLVFDHPVRISADKELLQMRIARLRRKLGRQALQVKKRLGYQLAVPVQFK